MSKETKRCDYCMPESREIFNNVGQLMSLEELVAIRGGIEALGRVLYCGDTKEICMPLLRCQKLIDKCEQGKH